MAIVDLNSLRPEARPPVPSDIELVASDSVLESLGIELDLRTNPGVLVNYLISASAKLNETEYKTKVKTLSGEIGAPPPLGMDVQSQMSMASEPELAALDSWVEEFYLQVDEAGGNMELQSSLDQQLQEYLESVANDVRANPPEDGETGNPLNLTDEELEMSPAMQLISGSEMNEIILLGEQQRQWDKKKGEWDDFIRTLIAKKADPTLILLAMYGMNMEKNGLGIASTLSVYKSTEEQRRALGTQFADEMASGGGTGMDAVRMTNFNTDQRNLTVDSNMVNQKLQLLTQDRQRYESMIKQVVEADHRSRMSLIANVRVTG